MRQYGAGKYRSFDTDPTIKCARAWESRVADEEIAEGTHTYTEGKQGCRCGDPACAYAPVYP